MSFKTRRQVVMALHIALAVLFLLGAFFRIRLQQTDENVYEYLTGIAIGLFLLVACVRIGMNAFVPLPGRTTPLVLVASLTFAIVLFLAGIWIFGRGLDALLP